MLTPLGGCVRVSQFLTIMVRIVHKISLESARNYMCGILHKEGLAKPKDISWLDFPIFRWEADSDEHFQEVTGYSTGLFDVTICSFSVKGETM